MSDTQSVEIKIIHHGQTVFVVDVWHLFVMATFASRMVPFKFDEYSVMEVIGSEYTHALNAPEWLISENVK